MSLITNYVRLKCYSFISLEISNYLFLILSFSSYVTVLFQEYILYHIR